MNFHTFKENDMLNGDGLRSVLWVSGCEAKCRSCFNPETWSFESGEEFTTEIREQFINSAKPDYISGITIVGGEPLHKKNIGEVYNIVSEFKRRFPNKTVWLYTGFTWNEIFEELANENPTVDEVQRANLVLNFVDVLVEGRYVDSLRDENLKWRGSSNQRVCDIKKTFGPMLDTIKVEFRPPVLYCD